MSRQDDAKKWELVELVRRIKQGDEESMGMLIQRLDPMIRKLVRRFHCEYISDEDLYQEACITIWESMKNFDENHVYHPNKLIGFFKKSIYYQFIKITIRNPISNNRIIDQMTVSLNEALPDDDKHTFEYFAHSGTSLTSSERNDPEEIAEANELKRFFEKVMEEYLFEEEKKVWKLYVQGYKRKEIMEMFGYDDQKMDYLLYKGGGKIKKVFEAWKNNRPFKQVKRSKDCRCDILKSFFLSKEKRKKRWEEIREKYQLSESRFRLILSEMKNIGYVEYERKKSLEGTITEKGLEYLKRYGS